MAKRIVAKYGTGYLFDKVPNENRYVLREKQMDCAVEDLYGVSGYEDIAAVVSSGAIASATYREGFLLPESDKEKAALAGVGQCSLMNEWKKRFGLHNIKVAQCLVTREELDITRTDPEMIIRRGNLRDTLGYYVIKGIIPIFNENDNVKTDEISYGDNDILAAYTAVLAQANILILFSNPVEGLGRGGGESKEKAKEICKEYGIDFFIINDNYATDTSGKYISLIENVLGRNKKQ